MGFSPGLLVWCLGVPPPIILLALLVSLHLT